MKPNQEFKNLLGVPSNTFYILNGDSIGNTVVYPGSQEKIHTLTGGATLRVIGSGTVRILLVGAGNTGTGGVNKSSSGRGGNGGKVVANNSYNLTEGYYSVVISNGNVSFNGLSATKGGGAAGGASRTTTGNGNPGGSGLATNIYSSVPTTYFYVGYGGGSGAYNTAPSSLPYWYGGSGTPPGTAGSGGYSPGSGGAASDGISAGGYGNGSGGGAADTSNNGNTTAGAFAGGAVFIVRYTPKN
jgi:hypothetical protein